jgi:predicted GIY-YIG superfamily endonuclease
LYQVSGAFLRGGGGEAEMKTDLFTVDILMNPSGRFYAGQMQNLVERQANHKREGPTERKSTRWNGPWILVHQEIHSTQA